MEQSFLHTHCSTVSLTSFRTGAVPDRQSPGWFPTSQGITGLRLSLPAGRCALTGHSRSADIAQNWLPPTPRSHLTTPDICLADTPEPLSLHIHSQLRVYKYVRAFTVLLFYMFGLSSYCCSRCPGFHRTAVLLLTELYTNRNPHGPLYLATEHNTPTLVDRFKQHALLVK